MFLLFSSPRVIPLSLSLPPSFLSLSLSLSPTHFDCTELNDYCHFLLTPFQVSFVTFLTTLTFVPYFLQENNGSRLVEVEAAAVFVAFFLN
jgi:hypothetical protein